MTRTIPLPLLLLLAFAPIAHAQIGRQVFLFQRFVTDPEARALGEAVVAERGILGAVDLNPALIGTPGSARISSTLNLDGGISFRTPWILGLHISAVYADTKIGKWSGAYQYKRLSLGVHELRDAQNNPIGEYDAYDRTHKLAVSYDLTDRITVGGAVNLLKSGRGPLAVTPLNPEFDDDGTSLDLGIVYTHDWSFSDASLRGSLGWSLTDFGKKVGADALPTTMRLGGSAAISSAASFMDRPYVGAAVYGACSKAITYGAFDADGTFHADGPWRSLFSTWQSQAVYYTLDGDPAMLSVMDQIARHTGVSLSVVDILEVRAGRLHQHELLGSGPYTTLGWGIDLYYVRLDRSWISSIRKDHPLESVDFWRLTARIPLTSDADNFWPELFRYLGL